MTPAQENISPIDQVEANIMSLHDQFWKALGDRDLQKRFSFCADNVTFIGTGLHEKASNKQAYIEINKRGIEQYPKKFKISFLWTQYSRIGDMAWVESEVEWNIVFKGLTESELIRNTVIFKLIKGQWKVVHVHGSVPDFRYTGKNYMTNEESKQKNRDLELQVYKRTKDLEKTMEELKNTQKQLIQSEKMASLGELTAGIAHEIQNPLNFVNNFSEVRNELMDEMNAELYKGDIEEAKAISADIKQNLEKINHHGKRADAIVKGMLQHSRSSSGQKEPTNINALADEYLRLAYHGLRTKDKSFNSELKTDFDSSLPKLNVVPQDIGRVILNLITNAFYAVNQKSKQGIAGYEPTVEVTTKKEGSNIFIVVKDNGNGIPDSIKEKIFQPFFTTKPTGQGTGLGLSLSYDIIKAHSGELEVETKEGVGTEFMIQLPIV